MKSSSTELSPYSLRRRRRQRTHFLVTGALIVGAIVVALLDVSLGHEVYGLNDIFAALNGSAPGGTAFSIMQLRMPRALVAMICGAGFGIAGYSFQTLLGNVLASPDIIGITAGANVAAVASITVFGLSGTALFGVAVGGGLVTACAVIALSWRNGLLGTRFLVGIGVASLLNAVTSWLMIRADQWDVQTATRWLTGSLADASWSDVAPAGISVAVGYLCLATMAHTLDVLRLGTYTATGLGVRVNRARIVIVVVSVIMLSIVTATTGPIAFVSFLSGPIAARLLGNHRPSIAASGAIGSIIVVLADIIAQHLASGHVPVGVMTSLVGGPVLVILVAGVLRKGV
jgi:iron complex transport system permease protein